MLRQLLNAEAESEKPKANSVAKSKSEAVEAAGAEAESEEPKANAEAAGAEAETVAAGAEASAVERWLAMTEPAFTGSEYYSIESDSSDSEWELIEHVL